MKKAELQDRINRLEQEILSLKRREAYLGARCEGFESVLKKGVHYPYSFSPFFPLFPLKTIIAIAIVIFAIVIIGSEWKGRVNYGKTEPTRVVKAEFTQQPEVDVKTELIHQLNRLIDKPLSHCGFDYTMDREQLIRTAAQCITSGRCTQKELYVVEGWLQHLNHIHRCEGMWNKTLKGYLL